MSKSASLKKNSLWCVVVGAFALVACGSGANGITVGTTNAPRESSITTPSTLAIPTKTPPTTTVAVTNTPPVTVITKPPPTTLPPERVAGAACAAAAAVSLDALTTTLVDGVEQGTVAPLDVAGMVEPLMFDLTPNLIKTCNVDYALGYSTVVLALDAQYATRPPNGGLAAVSIIEKLCGSWREKYPFTAAGTEVCDRVDQVPISEPCQQAIQQGIVVGGDVLDLADAGSLNDASVPDAVDKMLAIVAAGCVEDGPPSEAVAGLISYFGGEVHQRLDRGDDRVGLVAQDIMVRLCAIPVPYSLDRLAAGLSCSLQGPPQ